MLTIPSTIQDLYKADGIRKNVRVHFPNGEYSDLTNNDIVRESMHFSESACSRDIFRFGLAEASVIEFETVGVGNMYGMTIDCFIEIDTSSLSAEQITAIQNNPGDGAIVLAANSDIGWGFYRIALGQFEVMSCPRDHKAMTHRKVTAYGGSGYWLTRSDAVEQTKLSMYSSFGNMEFDARNYLLAKMARQKDSVLLASNLVKTQVATYSDFAAISGRSGTISATLDVQSPAADIVLSVAVSGYGIGGTDAIFGIKQADKWDVRDSVVSWIENYIDDNNLTLVTGPMSTHDYIAMKVNAVCGPLVYFRNNIGYAGRDSFARIRDEETAIYAYGRQASECEVYVAVPETITVKRSLSSTTLRTWTRPSMDASYNPVVFRWDKADGSITDPLEGITLKYEPTNTHSTYGRSYIGTYDPADLISGILEIGAYFASEDRTISGIGGMQLKRISDVSPVEIGPGQIEDLWWDEYDVEPIGSVLYSFRTSNGKDREEQHAFDASGSVYDMRGNAVLQSMDNASVANINSLLEASFIPYCSVVEFTPIDLTMQAWPWVEAGDALELTAEDETVVNSYMLTREIEGIQMLMDTVSASGGDIIEGG